MFLTASVRGQTLVVSFCSPVDVISWAVLNGGRRQGVTHIINHHTEGLTAHEPPSKTLRRIVRDLGLRGTVIGLMTGADVRLHSFSRASYKEMQAVALATAGCNNLATVGEQGNFIEGESWPLSVGTVNLIVAVNHRFTHEAMLEALAISTEAKVKAIQEAGLLSRQTSEPATGTGTDCIAIACGTDREFHFCGKHTKWGEMVGRASLESVRSALKAAAANTQHSSGEVA
ncbi:MAG TPA: adenosylcobinamide amidohydrolase [Candidatus Acidoferrales bacterium]|nr:adenosylcobinamide amidohydrolase [Candidatus Acidoferrales bacterium]